VLGSRGGGDGGQRIRGPCPKWGGTDGRRFGREVLARIQAAGLSEGNVDLINHAQQPKLAAFKAKIQAAVAELLGLPPNRVGVKATTNEGLDAIGRGEAIACWANVLLESRAS